MKGYRTIAVNILVGLGVLLASPDILNLIPKEAMPYIVAGQSIANILLRLVTTTPVGKTE